LQKKAEKDPPTKAKALPKVKKIPVHAKKVISFSGVEVEGVVVPELEKCSSHGRAIKKPVIFEKGI
jgi:hypothetical protein